MLKRTNEEGRQSLWGFPRPEITWTDFYRITFCMIFETSVSFEENSSDNFKDLHKLIILKVNVSACERVSLSTNSYQCLTYIIMFVTSSA